MKRVSKPILLLTTAAFALSACVTTTQPLGEKGQTGAVVGALFGAAVGANRKGGNKLGNAALGAAVGMAVGATIGTLLDQQEQALRNSLEDDRISIVNTGSSLVLTMPEAITFDTGSAVVRQRLRGDLRALADNLNEYRDSTVDVVGHTDNVGAASFNQELSARRAGSVASILVSSGVASNRIRAYGRGEDEPIASNLSFAGRAANRRVEIIIRPIQ